MRLSVANFQLKRSPSFMSFVLHILYFPFGTIRRCLQNRLKPTHKKQFLAKLKYAQRSSTTSCGSKGQSYKRTWPHATRYFRKFSLSPLLSWPPLVVSFFFFGQIKCSKYFCVYFYFMIFFLSCFLFNAAFFGKRKPNKLAFTGCVCKRFSCTFLWRIGNWDRRDVKRFMDRDQTSNLFYILIYSNIFYLTGRIWLTPPKEIWLVRVTFSNLVEPKFAKKNMRTQWPIDNKVENTIALNLFNKR